MSGIRFFLMFLVFAFTSAYFWHVEMFGASIIMGLMSIRFAYLMFNEE